MEELPRDELEAAIAARRELGRAHEPEVVDAFLARIEKQIDARVDEKLARGRQTPQRRGGGPDWAAALLGIASLGIGIGATGAATAQGEGGVAAVAWGGNLLRNDVHHRNRSALR